MDSFLLGMKLATMFLLRYFLFAGIAFSLFYIVFQRTFQKHKIQQKQAKGIDFRREIFYSVVTNLIFVAIALFVEFGPLAKHSQMYQDIHDFPLWYLPVSVILALIIHDTYFYWMHRFLHIEPFYSRMHKTHHLSTNPSPFASFAFHAGESVLEALIILILIFIMPIHLYAILAFTTSSLLINVYGHLGYEIMPKWFRQTKLFEVLNTSVHHNMHHQYFKGNYGLYFRFWDRLMGTENPTYVKHYEEVLANRDQN